MKSPTIVKRGDITYVLYHEKVVVGIKSNQWISYNQYDNWNRQGISEFRKAILKSKEDEYATPSDQISLAVACNIIGSSTRQPECIS